MTDRGRDKPPDTEGDHFQTLPDVVELELLLPVRMVADLESVARRRGLSMGQMMRRLVRDFLAEADACCVSSGPQVVRRLREGGGLP